MHARQAAHHTDQRERLPGERTAIVHKFAVGGHEGYIRCGLYPDGRLGEIFINMHKAGSTVHGIVDAFATAVSVGLQYGVPIEVFADKYVGSRFDPFGATGNALIPEASSILDYVFRYLLLRFGAPTDAQAPAALEGEA